MNSSLPTRSPRIVSLVPSATETLFALGAGDLVVGVSHECNYPYEASESQQVTYTTLKSGLTQRETDTAVKQKISAGDAIYGLDEELLRELEPTLIVTQGLCEVCAAPFDEVQAAAALLPMTPEVMSLDPTTLGEVLADINRLATAIGMPDAGTTLVGLLADRVDAVRFHLEQGNVEPLPVTLLEWLDPPFAAGHWVPQLIEMAGGVDLLAAAGERSRELTWEQLATAAPEVLIVAPCGYDANRAREDAEAFSDRLEQIGARQIFIGDGDAYFSRPGPRLVDGLEQLAYALHPQWSPEPAGTRLTELEI